MRKGLTSLNHSEAVWWENFRRDAEVIAWNRLQDIFPRLKNFDGLAGRNNGFRFQSTDEGKKRT